VADCNDLFSKFYTEVNLGSDKKDTLRTSRNAIREKIKKHFKEQLGVTQPKFYGQGSYMMNTMINPLDGEYDIDDGVYLQHVDATAEEEEWPKPATVHGWIVDATKGHTSTPPSDKDTCVRVVYQAQYHIDLPIYVMKDGTPRLAHKTQGWIKSDPRAMTTWFQNQVGSHGAHGDQLRRVVQYLKAWKDFSQGDTKLPSGLVLTILACTYFTPEEERDDSALVGTASAIHTALSEDFSVLKPVTPYEDLLSDWSVTRRDNFLSKLKTMVNRGAGALEEEDKTEASEKWIKVFGDRFPKYEPPAGGGATEMAKRTTAPAILGNHGRSAHSR